MPDLKISLRNVSKSYLILYLMLLAAGSMGTFFCAIFYLGSPESFRRTVQEEGLHSSSPIGAVLHAVCRALDFALRRRTEVIL